MRNTLLLFLICTLIACTEKPTTTIETKEKNSSNTVVLTEAQAKSTAIETFEIQQQSITSTLKLYGKTEVPPQNLVSVTSALGGYVKSIRLLQGQRFKKGQVLAILEDNQFIQLQEDYLSAKANLAMAEAEYLRQKELNQNKASSDKNFQQATTGYRTLQISKKALEEKLRLININPNTLTLDKITRNISLYAPFDGVVGEVFVNTGKYAAPSDVLFELVNPRDFLLNLKVFEKDLAKISIGQQVQASSNTNPDELFLCEIVSIGRSVNTDGSSDVYARIKDQRGIDLSAGMYVNAEVGVINKNAWVLPQEAIVGFEGKNYIFERLQNHTYRMLPVEITTTEKEWVEIKNSSSLQNKKLVRKGAYSLLMALKNKPEE
ncbi:efflux RND transporter periplasmic adaptor subunit [Paenimyroides ceti]